MWELRLARQDELEEIFALYAARVRWMDAAGIHQWNDTKYLERFPLGYFLRGTCTDGPYHGLLREKLL